MDVGQQLCDLFLQTDAVDVNGLDCNDESPLFHAARAGALRAMFVLLDAGCSLEIVNRKQLTVFQVCVRGFRDCAVELLMSGALMDEDLVSELTDRQADMSVGLELEQGGGGGGDGDDDDDGRDDVVPPLRVELLNFLVDAVVEAFQSGHYVRQILGCFRIGQQYLTAAGPAFYPHAVMCLNAAKFLCLKYYVHNSEAIDLLAEALDWQLEAGKKRGLARCSPLGVFTCPRQT